MIYMNINIEVGNRIKSFRTKQNLTQSEIADALQISPQAVSRWENGENLPDISLLVPLSRLLGVSTDRLLGQYQIETPEIRESVFSEVLTPPLCGSPWPVLPSKVATLMLTALIPMVGLINTSFPTSQNSGSSLGRPTSSEQIILSK